jgi:hypothetical protein
MADNSTTIRFQRFAGEGFMSNPGSRLATALVASFLLFGPYLANASRDYTRYCYFWRLSDTVSLLLLVLMVAACFALLGEAIRRTGEAALIRLCNHVFLLIVGAGLLGNMAFVAPKLSRLAWTPSPAQIGVGWLLIILVVAYSWLQPRCTLVLRCRQGCQILAPVAVLTFASLLLQKNYPEPLDPLPVSVHPCSFEPASDTHTSSGVYVFLFDEWSYERTFVDGRVLSRYPNLAAFARTATVYQDARSPAVDTERSLPGILFQTNDSAQVQHAALGFERGGTFAPVQEYQSIFARLDTLGYRGVMVGFALPFRLWLGDDVGACRSYCYYARPTGLRTGIGLHLLNAFRYIPDAWSHRIYKRLEQDRVHEHFRTILSGTRHDVHKVIGEWPAGTFLFAHLHLPHMPALMNPDLTFRNLRQTFWNDASTDGYESNLAAMDALAGEFLEALRQAGKFDDAIIVFTSDHGWRHDPRRIAGHHNPPVTQVPLIVKAPRQTEPHSVHTRFETSGLGGLIESLTGCGPGRDILCYSANQLSRCGTGPGER